MTAIEWLNPPGWAPGATWNPVAGCSPEMDCAGHCWARRMAHRLGHCAATRRYAGLTDASAQWTGETRFFPEVLADPLKWRKPRWIAVGLMGDAMRLSDRNIDQICGVMAACRYLGPDAMQGHVFVVLTKQAERMSDYFCEDRRERWAQWASHYGGKYDPDGLYDQVAGGPWPLPNVVLGVSARTQAEANERIPHLLRCPASVRAVSLEPLLEGVRFADVPGFNRAGSAGADLLRNFWAIVGGESGPGARAMNEAWVRSIRDQCVSVGVPLFYKQRIDENGRKVPCPTLDGKRWMQWPALIGCPECGASAAATHGPNCPQSNP